MKTSQLIKKLQEIDATVPFDADIVMGDDWMPSKLVKVYHEPPRTFLEFEETDVDELGPEGYSSPDPLLLSDILDGFQAGRMTKELALSCIIDACARES